MYFNDRQENNTRKSEAFTFERKYSIKSPSRFSQHLKLLLLLFFNPHPLYLFIIWLVVFSVPSSARSFREGIPIYCPLRRTLSSVFTLFPQGIKPGPSQSTTQSLRHTSFHSSFQYTKYINNIMSISGHVENHINNCRPTRPSV